MKRCIQGLQVLLGASFALLAGLASAQASYPTRTVTIVVPVAPGSSTDILARLLAERLPARMGQPFVVENRPGASGAGGRQRGRTLRARWTRS